MNFIFEKLITSSERKFLSKYLSLLAFLFIANDKKYLLPSPIHIKFFKINSQYLKASQSEKSL